MKKILFILTSLILTVTLAGCNSNDNKNTVTITDMAGVEVRMPVNPKKVAAVSPSTGDLLISFGLGNILDGTYYSVMHNPWVSELYPDSKDFFGYDYDNSVETFIERGVDLVLIPQPGKAEELRNNGINAICIRQFAETGYGDYVFAFSEIVKILWPEATDMIDLWQNNFNKALSDVSTVLENKNIERQKLYFICGDKYRGLGYTDLGKSLLEHVYDQFNIDFICKYFENNRPSVEAVAEQNPDIITIGGVYQKYLYDELLSTSIWNQLDAVKNERVYNIPVAFVGFEQTSACSDLFIYDTANKLYPEYFDYDINSMLIERVKTFYGVDITVEDANNMMNGLDSNGEPLIWVD